MAFLGREVTGVAKRCQLRHKWHHLHGAARLSVHPYWCFCIILSIARRDGRTLQSEVLECGSSAPLLVGCDVFVVNSSEVILSKTSHRKERHGYVRNKIKIYIEQNNTNIIPHQSDKYSYEKYLKASVT